MHLSGHYSNPPDVLEALLGARVVKRAVIRALAEADRVIDTGEAHMAVEAPLGCSVSRDSVNSWLSTDARGARPDFQRVGRAATSSRAFPDESVAPAPSLPLRRKSSVNQRSGETLAARPMHAPAPAQRRLVRPGAGGRRGSLPNHRGEGSSAFRHFAGDESSTETLGVVVGLLEHPLRTLEVL